MAQQTPVTFETVREIALALPGVEEGASYGTPAFRVRGKFLARLREDGETLVVKCDYPERDFRISSIFPGHRSGRFALHSWITHFCLSVLRPCSPS